MLPGGMTSLCEQTSQMYKSSWIPIRVIVFCTCEHSSFRKRVKYKGRGGTIEVKMLQVSRLKRRRQKKKKRKASGDSYLTFYIRSSVATREKPVSRCCYISTSALCTPTERDRVSECRRNSVDGLITSMSMFKAAPINLTVWERDEWNFVREEMVTKEEEPKLYSKEARGRRRCRWRREGVLKTVIIRGRRFVLTFSNGALKPSV